MEPSVIHRNDPFDRRAKLKRDQKIVAWLTIGHATLLPIIIIWRGGFLGLGIVALLAFVTIAWVWVEGVWQKWRIRRRLRAAVALGQIAGWLLVNGDLGIGVDAQGRSLHLFRNRKVVETFDVAGLRRLRVVQRRGWRGNQREVLFLSDVLAGPGVELIVNDGDVQGFLRHIERRPQGLALKLAASA